MKNLKVICVLSLFTVIFAINPSSAVQPDIIKTPGVLCSPSGTGSV